MPATSVRTGAIRYNRYLAEATERWPNLHVINWAVLARRNRQWHKRDGYHYNLAGARRRNEFLVAAMRNMAIVERNRQNPPPPPTDPGTSAPTTSEPGAGTSIAANPG